MPDARGSYLTEKAIEMCDKMRDLSQEMKQCEPLPQLSVLGTMTEPERREITSRLKAQDFKDGTVFMKQGWHGNAPELTCTGCAWVPASCGPYVPGAQGSLPLGPVHGTRAPYAC